MRTEGLNDVRWMIECVVLLGLYALVCYLSTYLAFKL